MHPNPNCGGAQESDGPYGAKGVGETGTMSAIPAVTAAIFDATGIWIHEIPVTPESVLRALRGENGGGKRP